MQPSRSALLHSQSASGEIGISRSLWRSLAAKRKVLQAVFLYAIASRMGHSRLGAVWIVLEPLALIAVFAAAFEFLERRPVYGPSQLLFHTTGVIPMYFFIRPCARARTLGKQRLNFPMVSGLDIFTVTAVLEFFAMSSATVIIFASLNAFDITYAIPFNIGRVIAAILGMAFIAAGVSLISAVVSGYLKFWMHLFALLARASMIVSGVFYVVDYTPENIRSYLILNPLVHGIVLFRSGFYPLYPAHTLDTTFFFMSALILPSFGLLLYEATLASRAQ